MSEAATTTTPAAAPAVSPGPTATPADVTPPPAAPPASPEPKPADIGIQPGGSPYDGILGSDGKFADGWLDKLGPEFDEYKATLSKYPTMPLLAKGLKDSVAAALAKQKGVEIPGKDATPEQVAAWRQARGIPDSADAYQFKEPEGVSLDGDIVKGFAAKAHEVGINPDEAQAILDWYVETEHGALTKAQESAQQAKEAEAAELRKLWGDEFDSRLQRVAEFVRANGGDIEDPFFGSAKNIRLVSALMRHYPAGEDISIQPDAAGRMTVNPGARATDIMTNPQNPLYQRYHANDREIVQMVLELQKRASESKKSA